MRVHFLPLVLLLLSLPRTALGQPPATPHTGQGHALLVGCTRYDNLPHSLHLEGPANDVLLWRQLLIDRYHFSEPNIVILSEAAAAEDRKGGDRKRPTRGNIEREFRSLAEKVQPGDRVVITLSGHGSREPNSRPDDPRHWKPDGLEEIFVPADVGGLDTWNADQGVVKNAIVGYEFAEWLAKIRAKQASVWVVVDACHSAGVIRGNDSEVLREVDPKELVPAAALKKARERARARAEKSRGEVTVAPPFAVLPDEPDLVVTYAAQATEPTVEREMPMEATDTKPYGLLTYTLCQALTSARTPLTYTELLQRIHDQYLAWGRTYPTPLIEGKDRDREVLGDKQRHTLTIRLLQEGNGWKVDAGQLHGLTAGSILAVKPPAGEGNDTVGYVKITPEGLGILDAKVEPCAYEKVDVPKDLPRRGRCEPVFIDYGALRIKVALDARTGEGQTVPMERRQQLQAELDEAAHEQGALVEVVASPRDAGWLLRLDSLESGKVYLVPASGFVVARDPAGPVVEEAGKATQRETSDPRQLPPQFGPVPAGEKLGAWLTVRFKRIASVQNLLDVGVRTKQLADTEDPLAANAKLEVFRVHDKTDSRGESIVPSPGVTLHAQDIVRFRITNGGREPVDVTLLYIDSEYRIHAVFPKRVTTDNRILPGKDVLLGGSTITAKTVGLENLILIAVKSKAIDQYATFSFLAEETSAEATREAGRGPSGVSSLHSPLGQLLLRGRYGEGKGRGLETSEVESEIAMQQLPWRVSAQPRPAAKKE